nr:exonuclease domain-containing protein [Microbacterium endophyticum]
MDFTAIDFETANSSSASACSVGLARVRDGQIVETTGWLIKPPPGHDAFFELNIGIHGIRADDVLDAKTWVAQLEDLAAFAGTDVLVAHNAGFDMAVLRRACEATDAVCPSFEYACSLQVARKAYDIPSYRLPFAAAEAGFHDFAHHDATADALACAHIMIDAARRYSVTSIADLTRAVGVNMSRVGQPVAATA